MCEPSTLFVISTALSAAQAAQGHAQANANADFQEEQQQENFKRTKALADLDAAAQGDALRSRQAQEAEARAAAVQSVNIEGQQAIGSAVAAAGDAGAAGNAVAFLLATFARDEEEFQNITARNATFTDLSFDANIKGIGRQRSGRIEAARPQGVTRPNFFNALLRVGGDALSAYSANSYTDADGVRHTPFGS
jgi:hypothetical protein